MAHYYWAFGSLIFIILGCTHLIYTFFTNKFSSRNKIVIAEMKASYPILTKRTTLWKAWVGFNASHSIGVLFFGIMNLYIALKYFDAFQSDQFFFLLNILIAGFYVWLGKRYWFNIPFLGALITFICYALSYIMSTIN